MTADRADEAKAGGVLGDRADESGASAPGGLPGPTADARPWVFLVALGLLLLVVVCDVTAAEVLRPARQAHAQAAVLALPGVAGLVRDGQVDPTELSQVASREQSPVPWAVPALAFLDVLVLVSAAAHGGPRLARTRNGTRGARLGLFLGSLAVLLGAMAVAVAAIGRLRYLVSLYLSPPVGTLSYLLLYGSFRRGGSLAVLAVLMALKIGASTALFRAYPRALGDRGLVGLVVTSVGATVLIALCYSLTPSRLGQITDALAGSIVALAAVVWAGVLVSGYVRRLA